MGRHSADPVEPAGTYGRYGAPPLPAGEPDPDAPVLMLPEAVRGAFRPVRPAPPQPPPATNGYYPSNGSYQPTPAPTAAPARPPDPGPAVHLPYIAALPEPPPAPAAYLPVPAPARPAPAAPSVGPARSILVTPPAPPPPSPPRVQVVVARPVPRDEDAPTVDRAELGRAVAPCGPPPVRAPRLPAPPPHRAAPPRLPPPAPRAALPAPVGTPVGTSAAAPGAAPFPPPTPAVADLRAPEPVMASYPPARRPPGPSAPVAAPRRPIARAVLSWVSVIVVAVLVAVGLRVFVVESFWIPSPSMEPTLHGCQGCNNDHVLVNKASYDLHPIHRGDVVVFDKPASVEDNDKYLIKRVIGLPGDAISGHDGKVWIGNRPLKEPYVNPACGPELPFAPRVVPKGQIFVMGDNRCDSFDSRMFGFVPETTVVGRAFLIVWPVARRHWL